MRTKSNLLVSFFVLSHTQVRLADGRAVAAAVNFAREGVHSLQRRRALLPDRLQDGAHEEEGNRDGRGAVPAGGRLV